MQFSMRSHWVVARAIFFSLIQPVGCVGNSIKSHYLSPARSGSCELSSERPLPFSASGTGCRGPSRSSLLSCEPHGAKGPTSPRPGLASQEALAREAGVIRPLRTLYPVPCVLASPRACIYTLRAFPLLQAICLCLGFGLSSVSALLF